MRRADPGTGRIMIHLGVRSVYSLLTSTITLSDYVQYARDRNIKSLSLIEEGSMHSAIKFFRACNEAGIKPIVGLKLEVDGDALTLIAKNTAGYQALLKLASGKPGVEKIAQFSGNLIIIGSKPYPFEHFFLGIRRTSSATFEASNAIIRQGKELGIPIVALHDVRMLYKDEASTLQLLEAIKTNELLANTPSPREEYAYLLSHEMESLYADVPEALANVVKIADQCDVDIPLAQKLLPKYPVPANDSSSDYLKALCYRGLKKRYGAQLSGHQANRLGYELQVLDEMGFSDYFLIVWDFIRFARTKGIWVGPGRGSAAGSLAAYVLGITNVDPIHYELLFERFLNPERVSMPDIDIDFQDNRRDEVIQYVSKKYGTRCVAQILTFGTFQSRSSWRDLARVHDIETKLINEVAAFIYSGASLARIYEQSDSLRLYFEKYPRLGAIFKEAMKIEGFPRHTSVHAAGIIISDNDLTGYTALSEGPNGISITQYEAEDLEAIGLLKMDFLGLKNLTMLERITAMVQQSGNPDFSLAGIPLNDAPTYQLIASGMTTGIFQLESSGMKQALKQVKPTGFEDIVACNALFRPGPMENIPAFAARKNGLAPVETYHPSLKGILDKTYGILVYQEQIMQLAAIAAGYSLGQADVLRRAVSKKDAEALKKEEVVFVKGAIHRGYGEKTARELYRLILKFANYGFNRSHAVAYSVISYQMAYLKKHFPHYFMAVSLTNVIGSERLTALYVKESRQMGLTVLPPSINESGLGFTVEGKKIRFSLLSIKQVGVNIVKQLIEERAAGKFSSFYDFVSRTRKFMGRRIVENLIDTGAFSEFGFNQLTLHNNLGAILDFSKYDGGLFASDFQMLESSEDVSPQEKMQREKELLGFYLSSHPILVLKPAIEEKGWYTPSSILGRDSGVIVCVGFVEKIRQIRDKNGKLMAFMDISDDQQTIGVTIFSSAYESYFRSYTGRIITLEATINVRKNEKTLVLKKIITIS